MSTKIFAYKVVRLNKNQSLSSAIKNDEFSVNYQKGVWTKPAANAPQFLFAFKSRQAARNFRTREKTSVCQPLPDLRIFKCEVLNSKDERRHSMIIYNAQSTVWPNGTMFVDAIKLIKAA
jgi:hypothetical protein